MNQRRISCVEPNHDGHRDSGTPCPGCDETKQNLAYPGLYELGLRADMLEVELKAACAACTHLHEKLEAAEARAEAASTRQAELQAALDEANGRIRDMNTAAQRDAKDWAQANVDRDRYKAKLQAVEALLKKPGCWSEWARECLAVISGGGK